MDIMHAYKKGKGEAKKRKDKNMLSLILKDRNRKLCMTVKESLVPTTSPTYSFRPPNFP